MLLDSRMCYFHGHTYICIMYHPLSESLISNHHEQRLNNVNGARMTNDSVRLAACLLTLSLRLRPFGADK